MAVQLFAYAKSKGYDVKIYADTTAVAYTPFEFTVADWKVTYDAKDAYAPGIIGSRMELVAPITQGEYSQNLENILQDADGIFYMTLSKNMGELWKGYCTPSVGTIEVINGQRFITIIAADGWHLLDIPSDSYTFSGVEPFTDQIANIFLRAGLWRVFNGFLVSKDLTRMYGSSALYDSLYLNGCKHDGVYNTGTSFHSFKEVLEGICASFGLRMYQDKGYIIFQDMTRPESSFNVYETDGSYQTNIHFSDSQTMSVIAGGTKMYQPPFRITEIQFQYPGAFEHIQDTYATTKHWIYNNLFDTYTFQDFTDLGVYFADGSGHIDYDIDIRIRYQIPAGYHDTAEWEIKLYFWLGEYTTDGGSTWTKLSTEYVRITANDNPSGDVVPVPGQFVYSTNNSHLPTVPSIGAVSLGLTVEAQQISGQELEDIQPAEAKWTIVSHGSSSPYRGYRADNSRRKLGEDVTFSTRFGDLSPFSLGAAADQQVVYVGPTQNVTTSTWPGGWLEVLDNGSQNLNDLTQITVNRIAQRRSVPLEYYEIDLHETSAVTHLGSWDGVDYFPVNVEYSHSGSRVTYAKVVNLPVYPDPLRYDTEL
jgi:hypothetical protein